MAVDLSDFKMPEKIVTRLLKESLPEDVVLSKDARNAACRSAGIFILQLSITAAERAQQNRRRTLDNKDIIEAAGLLGLEEYAAQLVRFGAQRKRNAKRKETNIQKVKSKRASQHESQHTPNGYNFDSNMETSETPDQETIESRGEQESMPATTDHNDDEPTSRNHGEDQYGDPGEQESF